MIPPEEHAARIREGLRKARKKGKHLGGISLGLEIHNEDSHWNALQIALDFKQVLKEGKKKTLKALARDLYEHGCRTKSGKPLTAEMVRRMRERLKEAETALRNGQSFHQWSPPHETRKAIRQRNEIALRWWLEMSKKERGESFAKEMERALLSSEQGDWVRSVLPDS